MCLIVSWLKKNDIMKFWLEQKLMLSINEFNLRVRRADLQDQGWSFLRTASPWALRWSGNIWITFRTIWSGTRGTAGVPVCWTTPRRRRKIPVISPSKLRALTKTSRREPCLNVGVVMLITSIFTVYTWCWTAKSPQKNL